MNGASKRNHKKIIDHEFFSISEAAASLRAAADNKTYTKKESDR